MTEQELHVELACCERKIARILEKNAHWRSCQDGSFEQACSVDGIGKYTSRRDEINLLLVNRGV